MKILTSSALWRIKQSAQGWKCWDVELGLDQEERVREQSNRELLRAAVAWAVLASEPLYLHIHLAVTRLPLWPSHQAQPPPTPKANKPYCEEGTILNIMNIT